MPSNPSDRHRIRLRGPWWRSTGSAFDVGNAVKIQWSATNAAPQPATSAPSRDAGFVLRRAFNRPTGLEAADRVYLVVEDVDHLQALELNGHCVWSRGESANPVRVEADITDTLSAANQLDLRIHLPSPALPHPALPCLGGEVRLEIAAG